MRLLQGAWLGLIFGVLCGLTALYAVLPGPSNGPSGAGGEECGTGVLGFVVFGPVIALVFVTIGGVTGILFGLLSGSLYDRWEYSRALKALRTVVSPHCPRCGQDATVAQRNTSPLCPGCGELLPRIPREEVSEL